MSRRCLLLVLLAFVFSGCRDSTAPTEDIRGAYVLRTVNGANLPYVELVATTTFELVSQTITLLDGGAFRVTGSVRITEGTLAETETFNNQGNFTRNGTGITFIVTGETEGISGSLANETITFMSEGLTYVFRK